MNGNFCFLLFWWIVFVLGTEHDGMMPRADHVIRRER